METQPNSLESKKEGEQMLSSMEIGALTNQVHSILVGKRGKECAEELQKILDKYKV